jgi:hypothetical protein
MSSEPRKATDVLLDVESKVNTLLGIIRAQDLNIKILSNKLNDVIIRLDKQQAVAPKFTVEAIQSPSFIPGPVMPPSFVQLPAGDPERTIPIEAESKLPSESSPQGFRRNSRPETYAGDNAYLTRPSEKMPGPPSKAPPGRQGPMTPPPGRSETVVPPAAFFNNQSPAMPEPMAPREPRPMPQSAQGQIPIMQRCVDRNGKSIFLADVNIVDITTNQPAFKARTNGTGKWMASLAIGVYRVTVRKQGTSIKDKLEAVQDIQVDGTQSPLELPMLIIK